MRFTDYFGRAFSSVGAAQFPWVKIFKESPVAKLVDVRILGYDLSALPVIATATFVDRMLIMYRYFLAQCCCKMPSFPVHSHTVTRFW